jgi:hypothetical protein
LSCSTPARLLAAVMPGLVPGIHWAAGACGKMDCRDLPARSRGFAPAKVGKSGDDNSVCGVHREPDLQCGELRL